MVSKIGDLMIENIPFYELKNCVVPHKVIGTCLHAARIMPVVAGTPGTGRLLGRVKLAPYGQCLILLPKPEGMK